MQMGTCIISNFSTKCPEDHSISMHRLYSLPEKG